MLISSMAASTIFNNLQQVSRSLQVAERKQIGLAGLLGLSWIPSSSPISEDVWVYGRCWFKERRSKVPW